MNKIFNILLAGTMFLTPGCIKYYELSESETPQATALDDQREIVALARRSVTVYNGFETRAIFNTIGLFDQVRAAYVERYTEKRGITGDAREQLLKRQLEENKHWLSFYVLADVRDKTNPGLGEPAATWTLSACIDKEELVVESIKEVDLEPEYQKLFGTTFNLFKTAYLVKFAISELQASKLSDLQFKQVVMHICSPYKRATMRWNLADFTSKTKVLRDEDLYWC